MSRTVTPLTREPSSRCILRRFMARQPFLPTYKNAAMQIGSTLNEELPKLAELIGRIAINWSGVDIQLSVTLGSLLGVENAAAVAVFASLRNHRAQRDAIRA